MEIIWLIPLLPGIGAAVTGLLGIRFFSKAQTALVACPVDSGHSLGDRWWDRGIRCGLGFPVGSFVRHDDPNR